MLSGSQQGSSTFYTSCLSWCFLNILLLLWFDTTHVKPLIFDMRKTSAILGRFISSLSSTHVQAQQSAAVRFARKYLFFSQQQKISKKNFLFLFLFSFFLLSLFAPLNGIQQLEDTSDTQLDQVLSTCLFVPYGHNFCVTQPCRYGVFC